MLKIKMAINTNTRIPTNFQKDFWQAIALPSWTESPPFKKEAIADEYLESHIEGTR